MGRVRVFAFIQKRRRLSWHFSIADSKFAQCGTSLISFRGDKHLLRHLNRPSIFVRKSHQQVGGLFFEYMNFIYIFIYLFILLQVKTKQSNQYKKRNTNYPRHLHLYLDPARQNPCHPSPAKTNHQRYHPRDLLKDSRQPLPSLLLVLYRSKMTCMKLLNQTPLTTPQTYRLPHPLCQWKKITKLPILKLLPHPRCVHPKDLNPRFHSRQSFLQSHVS